MGVRADRKAASRARILDAAARRIRLSGADGAGVAEVMADAGLTHGAFYSHFRDKDEMLAAALEVATGHRDRWLETGPELPESAWVERIARRYLNDAHRADIGDGCPYPSLAAEIARGAPGLRGAFQDEVLKTVDRLETHLSDQDFMTARDKAFALLSLFVGAMMLSRAVDDATGQAVLSAARRYATAAARNGGRTTTPQEQT